MGVQLAGSAVPEGVAPQLAIQLRHDWVARGAVSMVKAVIGIQSGGARREVARCSWLVLRYIACTHNSASKKLRSVDAEQSFATH